VEAVTRGIRVRCLAQPTSRLVHSTAPDAPMAETPMAHETPRVLLYNVEFSHVAEAVRSMATAHDLDAVRLVCQRCTLGKHVHLS
jgi:hypothetical protein